MLKRRPVVLLIFLSLLAVLISVSLVSAATEVDTSELRGAVTLEGVRAHQAALQAIADSNGGTRVATSPGYEESGEYVEGLLSGAGYQVDRQNFDFPFFQENSPPTLEQVSPNSVVYPPNDVAGFFTMEYSAGGDVTALIQAVDVTIPPAATPSSTSGCEASDFTGFTAGRIALIQRGTCNFSVKVENAAAAGAAGVIIFNEGQAGRTEGFNGTLGGPVANIPSVGASFAIGEELYNLSQQGDVEVHIIVDAISETRSTFNVIATTPGGRDDRVVVVGAHLDSVAEGPGINDNGSGTATILEIALQMADLGIEPRNKVVFAFWGAEEAGLHGSAYYVSQLSASQIKKIAVNLNFDMVGSPNYARFVYDGDGSATPLAGPNGSKNIEQVFLEYFGEQNLETEPTAFDGRSDYGPFIAVGIPAGGLFTGAEEINPDNGIAYDPCYHQACDTFANNNDDAIDEMSDAAAHAVLTFAETTSAVNGTDKGKGKGKWANAMEYRGSHLLK
ncbi:MAG: M20/M25/M40 family metallo-hydrolase [Anaerolineales bacterium]|nr:M20/M25/M40 family metallo-hydrolase [Anaerolineales bacterium]